MTINRRQLLQSAAMGAAAAALPGPAFAQLAEVKWASFTPGFLPAFTKLAIAKGIDRKHGVALSDPAPYSSLTAYYGDFVAGAFDLCFGSWDAFALRKFGGVPLKLVCTTNPGDMLNLVTLSPGLKEVADLKGKTLAAPTSTGTYRMMRALIREFFDFDLEKEMKVQNVEHPVAGITLLLADRADVALAWEPSVSIGISRNPALRVLLNMGEIYAARKKEPLPYFGIAVREQALAAHPGLSKKLASVFSETVSTLNSDPKSVFEEAESIGKVPTAVLLNAMKANRLKFVFGSMGEEAQRSAVVRCSEIMTKQGILPRAVDQSFFAA